MHEDCSLLTLNSAGDLLPLRQAPQLSCIANAIEGVAGIRTNMRVA